MRIRPATPKDRAAIKDLIAAFPSTLVQDHLPQTKDFFVAEEKGNVIGCCALEIYSPKIAEIRSLAVQKEFQGRGIATKLVHRCVNRAKSRAIRQVLSITGSHGLFDKLGFKAFNKEKYALFKIFE